MSMMRVLRWLGLVVVASAVACSGARPPSVEPPRIPASWALALAGEFSIAPLQRLPSITGLPFGGISGLASYDGGREMLGICDTRQGSRLYRLGVSGEGPSFSVTVLEAIPLEQRDGTLPLDAEGVAITPRGTVLVSSEGYGNEEPRVPPVIMEYRTSGAFIRRIEVRPRYLPNPTGPQTTGVRPNMGFEALTITPKGDRVFTATESALVQDGPAAGFDAGAQARLLEYTAKDGTYAPAREFVYPVDPIPRPDYETSMSINGLVELLAIDDAVLISMERAYVREAGATARDGHRIRLFRVSLDGATDVSAIETLNGAAGIVPVTKTLLLELADVRPQNGDLGTGLDNFEGLAFGPALADGRAALLIVSDDNFNPRQRTWFLQIGVARR
jgi:hypothetical protein